jgi:hypothetical protein
MQLDALLDRLKPLLEWNQDGLKVLLYPIVRYLHDCCLEHPRSEQQRKDDGVRMLKELYQLRRAVKTGLIQKKIRNVILVDPLACLGAAADLSRAETIMADNFHLTGEARGVVASRIKEQIVAWLRGLKRPADTAMGADSKRPRMDRASPAATNGKKGLSAGKSKGAGRKKSGKGANSSKGRDGGCGSGRR